MENNISFYLQKNNSLFGGTVLAVCYQATPEEMEKYSLTSQNIVVFLKYDGIDKLFEKKDVDYVNEIKKIFNNKDIILRIQSECFLGIYGDSHCDCEKQRLDAINIISEKGGIFIHLPQEAQGWGLHYKLKELDLQVVGRMPNGEFVGPLDRDNAQKVLLNQNEFRDNRNYEIINKILTMLGINKNRFFVLTDSDKKINGLTESGLSVHKYSEFDNKSVNSDNLSEYLIKICNLTHRFDDKIVDNIINIIRQRNYNERTLEVLINIVDKINNDEDYKLETHLKQKFLDIYEEIICGEEKRYILEDAKRIKIQNNFSCRVNPTIFKALCTIYGEKIFDRVCLEKIYYFQKNDSDEEIRVRTSQILDCDEDICSMFNGQIYTMRSILDKQNNKIIQQDISTSTLRSYFENPELVYKKRVEMITIISEKVIPNVNIYIKRIPCCEDRIMDVYGKKEDIKKLINSIIEINDQTLLNIINDKQLSEQNFSQYNLRFADLSSIMDEELYMYSLTKEVQRDGVRSKVLFRNGRIK